jgi:hypothetical protein
MGRRGEPDAADLARLSWRRDNGSRVASGSSAPVRQPRRRNGGDRDQAAVALIAGLPAARGFLPGRLLDAGPQSARE